MQNERLASYRSRLSRLDESIDRAKAAIQTNSHDVRSMTARVQSPRDIEAMNEKLTAQQFQSNMKLLESRERRQEVERELISTRNRGLELKKELAGAEAEKDAFIREWQQKATEELVTVRRERDAVAEQLKKVERRSRMIELIAPHDAVVQEVAARSTGSVIREAEPLITLVPLGETLQAEVQVAAQDVGYVKLQDPVRLKIDAFPFQKHGLIHGTLEKLEQDAFTKDGLTEQSNAPYYLGRAALQKNELRNLPYVMYPVMRGLDEAIRES